MKAIFINILLLSVSIVYAQSPQFAVVRPNGTTYICPSWDSAYNKAVDGDNIYLPGVTINTQFNINKKLSIFGAGHHPDSTLVTGKTNVGGIQIQSGASGSFIEGVQTGSLYLYYSGTQIRNITVKRCSISIFDFNPTGTSVYDSLPTNILISECLVDYINFSNSSGNIIQKSLLRYGAQSNNYPYYLVRNTSFKNNIFLPNWNFSFTSDNCSFENNIFLNTRFVGACSNFFYNNILVGANNFGSSCGNTITEVNTISVVSANDVFISYTSSGYPYVDNYHLKSTCPGKNAGTDGTDVGIYGTDQPTSEGWVPSNPHIYYKQVGSNTTTDGKLHVKFKVRTNQ